MGWNIKSRGPTVKWGKSKSPKNRSYYTARQRTVHRRAALACLHPLSSQIGGGQCGECGKFVRRPIRNCPCHTCMTRNFHS